MVARGGISGLAVAMAAAGGLLLWTGITNRPIQSALQDLVAGRPPGTTGDPTGPSLADVQTELDQVVGRSREFELGDPANRPAPTGALNTFMATIRAQIGKPYVWGAAGPNAFDCSGLVTYALKAAGLDDRRRVTAQYLIWGGAYDVPRSDTREADLVCWSGHIGVAINQGQMIHAPSAGRPVQIGRIWDTPSPKIRRIKDPESKGVRGEAG